MSDTIPTPRTDAESGDACERSGYAQVVSSDFARTLERELSTARESALREAINLDWGTVRLWSGIGIQRQLQSLIATPASECECPMNQFALRSFDAKWNFCPRCGKAIAQK